MVSDRSGKFVERGGDVDTFVDCFYAELIVPFGAGSG